MSQHAQLTEVAPVRALSLWLAAIGFFMLAIGELLFSWFPEVGRLEFTLQAAGPVLVAVAFLSEWRTNVARWGWGAFILFFIAILSYGVLWIPYMINPESLGNDSATQRGFFTVGIGFICAAIGIFLVMRRKETQLEHPTHSGEPQIKASVTQLVLLGVGILLNGVNWIWVGQEESHFAEFSLPIIGCLLILIAVISARDGVAAQVGLPAAIAIIVAVLFYTLHFFIDALPAVMDPDWRLTMRLTGIAFALGGVACALSAMHHQKAPTSR